MVDIRRKKCEVAGCRYAASYGDTVERTKRFCARHKLDGMFSYQDLVGCVTYHTSNVLAAMTDDAAHERKLLDSKDVLRSLSQTALPVVMEC